jgi:hypothetical protein
MSRGGSRWGAGRPAWKAKAEHCRSIDARRWKREGILLSPGRLGGWGWTDPETGKQTASIGYTVGVGAVTLDYSVNGEPISQRVPALATGCTYGGKRYWFGCPRCGKRAAILYLRSHRFACRTCQRLAYASQSEDEIGRMWRKQSKLEARLGKRWARPTGMHRTTHERLLQVIWNCEEMRDAALSEALVRLGWPG